jgi:hypothetical protein
MLEETAELSGKQTLGQLGVQRVWWEIIPVKENRRKQEGTRGTQTTMQTC